VHFSINSGGGGGGDSFAWVIAPIAFSSAVILSNACSICSPTQALIDAWDSSSGGGSAGAGSVAGMIAEHAAANRRMGCDHFQKSLNRLGDSSE